MLAVAGWLREKKAEDLMALDVNGLCGIAEGLVLATAGGVRHAKALAEHVLKMVKQHGIEYMGMEGHQGGNWILVDLNDVLVHIFQADSREFYNLEGLWSEAERLELPAEVQEG
jgi:ribosome-associated protein